MSGTTARHLVIEGARIVGIPSFYDEVNRVFMADEPWKLGPSLDALDDLLYGGYGCASGADGVVLTWRNYKISAAALGRDATLALLRSRIGERSTFNGKPILEQITALEAGQGKTYLDVVMDVFAGHRNVEVIKA